MIYLKPTAGLCNRMRAIDSALGLAQVLDSTLHIYWVRGSDLNCPFNLLFEPPVSDRVMIHDRTIRPLKFISTHRRLFGIRQWLGIYKMSFCIYQTDQLKHLDVQTLDRHCPLTIESFSRFYPTAKDYAFFNPIPMLAEKNCPESFGIRPAYDRRTRAQSRSYEGYREKYGCIIYPANAA